MKNPSYIFGQTLHLMVALQNALSVLQPSMFVWALARKHPWCFHSHSGPVLLTSASAFMWPDPKVNLGTHNMFINQLPRTNAAIMIQFWSHIQNEIWQIKDIPGDVLQYKSVALQAFILVPQFIFSLLYKSLSVNIVLLNAPLISFSKVICLVLLGPFINFDKQSQKAEETLNVNRLKITSAFVYVWNSRFFTMEKRLNKSLKTCLHFKGKNVRILRFVLRDVNELWPLYLDMSACCLLSSLCSGGGRCCISAMD